MQEILGESAQEQSEDYRAVARAFSLKAEVYDLFAEGHPLLWRMRDKVRHQVLNLLSPGDSILEINAGTGSDAVYFAKHGFRVHATDIAPKMIERIRHKIAEEGLGENLTTQQLSFTHLSRVEGKDYHLLFSNMGGVNCTKELETITRQIDAVLRPGGYVVWVVMPPLCLWELAQAFKGNFAFAFRRLTPKGILANIEGMHVRTYYHPVSRVVKAFGAPYEMISIKGLSVFTPPADHKTFAFNHPRLYAWLCRLDGHLSDRTPFNRLGDFYILTMKYSPNRIAEK